MNPVVSTMRRRVSRSVLVAVAATLVSSPLFAQAAPEKPTQALGIAFVGRSGNDNTVAGGAGFYIATVKRFYASVGLNYLTKDGNSSLDGDYQLGYAFFKQVDATRNARNIWAITGGLYQPQEGDIAPMVALNGIAGKHTQKWTTNATVGYIFPEVGDPLLLFRAGIGFIF
jgi:hypothetical protein